MNFLRLGVFTGAKQIQDERQARADKAAAEQRQRMLDDLVMDRQMRGAGYVPDAEAGPDGSLSGRSLDAIVGAATGIPTVGMKDTGTRYGQSVGGYKYDRMSLPVRKQQAEIAKAEREANEPYRNARPAMHYDESRGALIDPLTGKVIIPEGLPEKGLSPIQQDINEQRKFQRSQALGQNYQKNPTVSAGYDLSNTAAGIKAGLAGTSPMDDLSLVYGTVKMFDPSTGVKDQEIKMAQSGQSLPGELRSIVNKWNTGRVLTPEMRQQIGALIDRKVAEQQRAIEPIQKLYGEQARRYGVQSDSAFIAPSPFNNVKPAAGEQITNAQRRRAASEPDYAEFLRAQGKLP